MSPASELSRLSLLDLLTTTPLGVLAAGGLPVRIDVPDAYLGDERLMESGVEVLAIQRMLTLAQRSVSLSFNWEPAVAKRVLESPAVHPLASVALCLANAKHDFQLGTAVDLPTLEKARAALLKHRLKADMFTESQVLVCVDHRRTSLPPDLYDAGGGGLLAEDQFESFVDDMLSALGTGQSDPSAMAKVRLPTAVMIRELIENTDDHAKTDAVGQPLKPNGLRGLVVKRVLQARRMPNSAARKQGDSLPCLELSIFDSGLGYYDSYRRQLLRGQARGEPVSIGATHADVLKGYALGPGVPIEVEYSVLLKCLERHAEASIPDPRPGHRGMGLYEVLRALKGMRGLFEVRTGRLHGYRSFLEGELRLQLESQDSDRRPGMPKPSLLDVTRRSVPSPTEHEQLLGSVVRILVPLA